ncbi:uncharacterized protein [Apostichopus japonicus]|uniref:uncharacterized protein isoform X2 n=1 Tax=Stichopus japonicus TaxID=307972 RepID=UPI003AB50E39
MDIYLLLPLAIFILPLVAVGCTGESVKLTLLALNYTYDSSTTKMSYQCYVSDPDSVTMTSSRTVWTRDAASQNPPPPGARYYNGSNYNWPRFIVKWNNGRKNHKTFGVFDCTAKINGKDDTTVSHIRMRSDADIFPANDLLSQTFSINDSEVSINMMSPTGRNVSTFMWMKDNVPISSTDGLSNYTIMRPLQLDDAGVFECYIDGERSQAKQALNLLIVRACPATRWGPPACTGVCNSCYNGGICDENTGECVCPPGFKGDECKTECGYNRFGDDCEFRCSVSNEAKKCSGYLFCLRHPFGCRCVTGYNGIACNRGCEPGTYGASCLQTCHCNTSQCNPFTGECDAGCSSGWNGSNCQECDGNFYGSDCSQKCHCDKERCNRESGLCQTGGCLPQWVDLFPPFSCQTGLIDITYAKQNPGTPGRVTCVVQEGPGGNIDGLDLLVSRDQRDLILDGIVSEGSFREGSTKIHTFIVSNVREGDKLYCQLRKNNETLAMLHVTVEVYTTIPTATTRVVLLEQATIPTATTRVVLLEQGHNQFMKGLPVYGAVAVLLVVVFITGCVIIKKRARIRSTAGRCDLDTSRVRNSETIAGYSSNRTDAVQLYYNYTPRTVDEESCYEIPSGAVCSYSNGTYEAYTYSNVSDKYI